MSDLVTKIGRTVNKGGGRGSNPQTDRKIPLTFPYASL